jgi:ElaB/YqjD/DUF883 family membrane-anchored ribosome-binding protein
MALFRNLRAHLADTHAQIHELQGQVEALVNNRLTPIAAGTADRVRSTSGDVWGNAVQQAKMMPRRVRQQPLLSILMAAALGWVIGRVIL